MVRFFFVAVITPCAFWVILSMNASAFPLAVGEATADWVLFAPMFAGVISKLALAAAALFAPVPPWGTVTTFLVVNILYGLLLIKFASQLGR